MDKKYQVFISSTYTDLKEEREKAINSILKLEHIPIGMELFNAGDSTQWAIIQRAIDNTDYYILIVGFRYGTVTDEEISYTELEYDYAVSKKIPVMAFIKDKKVPSTDDERESKPKYQKKLDSFIAKVQQKEVNYWKNSDELAALITSSLVNQIKLTPRTGWIRADFDPIAISQEMAELSKENRELRRIADEFKKKHPDLNIMPIDSNNRETSFLKYKYQRPEGNVYVRSLTVEDDLIEEVKDLVSEQDLKTYNNNLPSKEQIDDFNKLNTLYENAHKNAHCFEIVIRNNGNGKANNVFVDLMFPKELLVYYDFDIETIKRPKKVELPINPVKKALRELRPPIKHTVQITAFDEPDDWGSITTGILDRNYERDYVVNDNHDTALIKVDSIVHSRMYTSDEIWFVATQKGTFTIDCQIMCEEYEEPTTYSFTIEIE